MHLILLSIQSVFCIPIFRLTKLDLSRNQKRFRGAKNDADKSSSDAEKPKSKKSKKITSKKPHSEDEATSEDEPLTKLSKNNSSDEIDTLDVNQDLKESPNKDEHMADIAVVS